MMQLEHINLVVSEGLIHLAAALVFTLAYLLARCTVCRRDDTTPGS